MEFEEYNHLDGKSHVMAIAIRRLLGGTFKLFCEQSGSFEDPETGEPLPTICHIFVKLPDGRLADADGIRTSDKTIEEWESMNDIEGDGDIFSVITVDDEIGLEKYVSWDECLPLNPFEESDVANAQELFLLRNGGQGASPAGRYLN
ncbi:hypothetical protein G6L37_06000 [Agrobacterium rubi]|nr:hypothetical protein [Agrobacterium rubi]NTF24913.1 hypothetical protein [Agrobacterium rubi]